MISAVIALLAPIALGQSHAAAAAEAARLNACIQKIEKDPENAYEDGIAWLNEGGRPPARQCTAMALIALGLAEEGAARLEELANAKDAGDLDQRAVYLAQAGNAWLLARSPDAAIVAFSNELKLRPRDADAHKDRARAYVLLKKWDEAGKDLDAANELSPGDAETLRLRAQALLELGRIDDATKDIKQARKVAPKDVQILVMRGRVVEARRLKNMPDDPNL